MQASPAQTQGKAEPAPTHWKLTLSYNGSGFHGWQVQPGLNTVQGTLAQAIRQITGADVLPQGAGRTDAGVHALAQVATFTLPVALPAANFQRALNRTLPSSIRVQTAELVPPGFHARHSARRKYYEYRLFEQRPDTALAEQVCSPFLAPFVWDCRWLLDLDRLQQAAGLLPGTRDFSAMAASRAEAALRRDPSSQAAPNPVKTIYSADWQRDGDLLVFRICGSGFLHHMVRNLVGTMVDIGRGHLAVNDLERILQSRNRTLAGPTAPATGLFLRAVEFDPVDQSQAPHPHENPESDFFVEKICDLANPQIAGARV